MNDMVTNMCLFSVNCITMEKPFKCYYFSNVAKKSGSLTMLQILNEFIKYIDYIAN